MKSLLERLPRLARHTAVYVTVPVLVRALYFGLVPVFTRYLTPGEYGAWGYVTVAATMLGTLAPLGLLTAYNYALRRPESWPCPAAEIRRAALQTAFVLTLIAGLAGFLPLRRLDLGMPRGDLIWILVLAATVVGTLAQAAKRRFQMIERPRDYVRVEVTTGLTLAGVSLTGVILLELGLLGLALGLLAGAGAGLIVSVRSILPDLVGRVSTVARRAAVRFGFPLFIHTTAAILLLYVDRFMLERLSTLTELGYYSLASQIGTAMLLITTSTNQAYLPFLYRNHREWPDRIRRGQRYVALFFTTAGILGVLLTIPFMRYLIDPRYGSAEQSAQVLLIAGVLHGFYFLAVGRLVVAGRMKAIAAATVAVTFVNVLLNLAWIPRWHARGAAWATLASEALLFGIVWMASRRLDVTLPSPSAPDVLEAGS